jgi:hypothetical protein
MIVRISGEGQWRLSDEALERVNALDNAVVAAAEAGDEAAFTNRLAELCAMVRDQGEHVPDDELIGSDVIVPPADSTMAEAAHAFSGEGLIPD